MVDKMECFYTAQNVITSNIDNENKIIMMEYGAALERAKVRGTEMPSPPVLRTVNVDDIIALAECIARYARNSPPNPSLLTE